MGYINNETITVEAVLTKKGREILASKGNLNITSFALADDEMDYRQYNPNHPNGSQYYDVALRNTPVFEPLTDETQSLKYKLVSLPAGTSHIPVIKLGQSNVTVNRDYNGNVTIQPTTEPTYNTSLGYTAILSNRNVGTIEGTGINANVSAESTIFLGDTSSAQSQTAVGMSFIFKPNSSLSETSVANLTIIGNESGGSITIPVTVVVDVNSASGV